MARALEKAGTSKGQKNITAFFAGASGKPIPKPAPKAAKKKSVVITDDEHEEQSDDMAIDSFDEPATEPPSDAPDDNDESSEDESEAEVVEDTEEPDPGATSTRKISTYVGAPELPPISSIPAIFLDMVKRFPKIKSVVEHLKGRKMRVATMCSGTESPLLALDLIRRGVLELYGLTLEFDHVFSCEIEPFKQAYIERNFHPPLLFRDVCELGNSHA